MESEILLLPCSYFEVKGVLDHENRLHIVQFQRIEPSVILIQPPSRDLVSTSSVQSSTHAPPIRAHSTTLSSMNKSLDLNIIKDKLEGLYQTKRPSLFMGANDEYLLFPGSDHFPLIDKQGQEKLRIERNFDEQDICWSAYLDQFLILTTSGPLRSFDITPGKT